MQRLLVISCSERKLAGPRPLPAIERYDGPAFRVLRKYLRECSDPSLTMLILSAKHGLIEAERRIAYYDCRLTRAKAIELRPQIDEGVRHRLRSGNWEAVGVSAGREYALALDGLPALIPDGARLDHLAGGLGLRLTKLRRWLREPTSRQQLP